MFVPSYADVLLLMEKIHSEGFKERRGCFTSKFKVSTTSKALQTLDTNVGTYLLLHVLRVATVHPLEVSHILWWISGGVRVLLEMTTVHCCAGYLRSVILFLTHPVLTERAVVWLLGMAHVVRLWLLWRLLLHGLTLC